MTRQAEAAESPDELFLDERLAGEERAIDEVIAAAGGERSAIRALLTQLGEVDYARAAAEASGSLGYRRGLQPGRPAS